MAGLCLGLDPVSLVGKESLCCRLLEDLSITTISKRVGVSNSPGLVSNFALEGGDRGSESWNLEDIEVLTLGDFTGEVLTDFFFLSFRLDENQIYELTTPNLIYYWKALTHCHRISSVAWDAVGERLPPPAQPVS